MRVGVIGSIVWDVIHSRDIRQSPVQEWGGITYALSGLDAALPAGWEIVPIMKVGSDLAARATEFIHSLRRIAPDAALIEVPYANNRVELRYFSDERRTEVLTGGVPGWSWVGLKPAIDTAKLDALYINFLSGWELDLDTARVLRSYFHGPIYCDFHMKVTSVAPSGLRVMHQMPNVAEWCECFDLLQVNEDEMAMMAPDPMALAATAIARGVRSLTVTLGKRGAVYFAAPGFDRIEDLRRPRPFGAELRPLRTALVPTDIVTDAADPTGCGDVWGSTYFSRLFAGDNFLDASSAAHRAAGRNLRHRGATGLAAHLRGELSVT